MKTTLNGHVLTEMQTMGVFFALGAGDRLVATADTPQRTEGDRAVCAALREALTALRAMARGMEPPDTPTTEEPTP